MKGTSGRGGGCKNGAGKEIPRNTALKETPFGVAKILSKVEKKNLEKGMRGGEGGVLEEEMERKRA